MRYIVIVSSLLFAGQTTAGQASRRILSCEGPFRLEASAASLAQEFGASNVTGGDIDLGEGFTEAGTIVFGDSPLDRVEVLWHDAARQRQPRTVTVRQPETAAHSTSNWRTPSGLTVGIRLRDIERRNRRPFRLVGFGWDYGGTVVSWAGGLLESDQPSGCRSRARLTTGELPTAAQQRWDRQVSGSREFSSGHLAMQALDPYVFELRLHYTKPQQ